MASRYLAPTFLYQGLATPVGDPPPPPPAPELSWSPVVEKPVLRTPFYPPEALTAPPQAQLIPVPDQPHLTQHRPTLPLPRMLRQHFTTTPPAAATPTAGDAILWIPVCEQPTQPLPPLVVADYVFPIFTTLPPPPAFMEAWQLKVQPTPPRTPSPPSVALVDASLFVPAVPVERWSQPQPRPVLRAPNAFGAVVTSPLPVFTSQFLAPEPAIPRPLPRHLPGDALLQVLSVYPQPAALMQGRQRPVVDDHVLAIDLTVTPPLTSIVPVDRWFAQPSVPDFTVADQSHLSGAVAGFLPVVTLDHWYQSPTQPTRPELPSIAESVVIVEPSLLVVPSFAWYQPPQVPQETEPILWTDLVKPLLVISSPDKRGFVVMAASFFIPGTAAAGMSSL